jgi:hypothetical protein
MILKYIAMSFGVLLVVSPLGCGSSGDSGATNGSSGGGPGGDSGPGGDGGNAAAGCGTATPGVTAVCTAYPATSIAAMRGTPAQGCFELAHVGLVARTDSPTEPRLYVQDKDGADFSAIIAKCSATAQHGCAPAVAAKIPRLHDTLATGAQITLRGYYEYGKVTGFEQFYIEDIIDECASVPRPAPIALTLADITRDARPKAKWFRRATVDVSAQDPLTVYDLSPAELQLAQGNCPNWAGFAMIPKSAGVAAGTTCAGTTNPAGRAADPREVLVGRQFFDQFLYSSDCGCAAGTNQRLLTPTNTVSGNLLGYLLLEQDKGSTTAYQVFEPAADKTFPVK